MPVVQPGQSRRARCVLTVKSHSAGRGEARRVSDRLDGRDAELPELAQHHVAAVQ